MRAPVPRTPGDWPARLGRAAIRAATAAVLAVLFVAASSGGLLWHLDLPATRRLTRTVLSTGLSRLFAGKFSVGVIEILRPDRVELGELAVLDPEGRQVLRVSGLRVHAELWSLAWQLLGGGSKTILIDHVRAERVECQVIPNPKTGIPTLAEAFAVAPSKPGRPGTGKGTEVKLPSIEIGKAWGQGRFENLPLLDAEVTRARGSVLVRPGATEIDVERFAAALRGIGGAVAQGTATLRIRVPGAVSGTFEGRMGDVEVTGSVRTEKGKLMAELSLPGAEPDALRVLWPAWPVRETLRARVAAQGALPVLDAKGDLEAGRTKVTALGPVRLVGDVGAHLELKTEHLDLGALLGGVPRTDLESSGGITFLLRQGHVAATFNAATRPSAILGQPIPSVDLTGHLNPQGLQSELVLHEPGMSLKAEVAIAADGSLDVTAKTGRFRLQQSPRLRALAKVDAEVDVEAKAHLDREHLDATTVMTFRGLSWGPIRAGQGRLNARLRGETAKLSEGALEADLESSDVKAGLFSLSRVEVTARGPLGRPELRARMTDAHGLGLVFTGRLAEKGRRLQDLHVVLSRTGASIEGKVDRLDIARGAVDVNGLELKGAGGRLTGSAHLRPDTAEIQAEGADLDLDLVSRVVGLPPGLAGGKARVTADISVGTDVSRGRLRLSVADGSIAYHRGIDWDLAADLTKEHVEASSRVNVKDLGEFEARLVADLAGSPLRPAAWRRAVGEAALYINRLDLVGLRKLASAEDVPGQFQGNLEGWVNVGRHDPNAWPNVVAKLGTQKFSWDLGDDPSHPKRLEGVELEFGASLEGETGRCQLFARAVDLKGTLAAANVQATLDLEAIEAHPKEISQKLAVTPIKVVLDVPERALGAFPEPLRVSGVAGRVEGHVVWEGKLEDPIARVTVSGHDLRLEQSRFELPVDANVSAQYQSSTGRFWGNGDVAQAGRRVAALGWQVDLPWQAVWLGSDPDQPSWRGDAELTLLSFPLATVPVLADARVGGSLRGTVALKRRNLLPTAHAELELSEATTGNVSLGSGKVSLDVTEGLAHTSVALSRGPSRLVASLDAGVGWGNDFFQLDRKRPVRVEVHAQALDAALLGTVTADALSHVSGTLDGDVEAEFRPVPDQENPEKLRYSTQLKGQAKLKDGVLGLVGLGLELRRATCLARATSDGSQSKIELRELAASARSSQQNVKGWADLVLQNGQVTSGQGALTLDQVPLPIEGVSMATIGGNATLALERKPDAMWVDVTVPELVAKLPLSSTRSVISLRDNPNVAVAQPLGEPATPRSAAALPWVIAFDLGQAVHVERGDVYLPVTGKPRLRLGGTTELDGYVDLEPGGRLPALGKVFQVEAGRVWFDSAEPSNPNIAITASWRGPDATVYVDIRGRWRNAKLSLRSEPPRPEAEIMLVLLQGGSPEEAAAAGARGQAFVGAQTAANALGVSDLFSGTPLGGLQLHADTSQGSGSYAATFRVSDRVWLEGIYRPQQGTSQSSASSANDPAQAQRQDSYAGAVDLRLGRSWSLRTEGGNASAAVDLLWQYRY
jgi:translocation and assembly module TamB